MNDHEKNECHCDVDHHHRRSDIDYEMMHNDNMDTVHINKYKFDHDLTSVEASMITIDVVLVVLVIFCCCSIIGSLAGGISYYLFTNKDRKKRSSIMDHVAMNPMNESEIDEKRILV